VLGIPVRNKRRLHPLAQPIWLDMAPDDRCPLSALNPDVLPKAAVEQLKSVVAPFEDGVTYDVKDEPLSPLSPATASSSSNYHAHQPVAQWSVQPFQPVVVGYEKFVDEELERDPSGSSVMEKSSIVGESGRTYHSYKSESSRYLLPNEPGRVGPP
jgi:hypothetical protein